MPDIDVSDVLTDPVIAGEVFNVIRRREVVNIFGESTVVESVHGAVGSVTPVGNNSLLREEAFQTGAGTIKVVTSFRLRGPDKAAGAKFQPDIVYWKGGHYVVRIANDFTQYGAGIIEAECSSIDFTDQAPGLPIGALPGAMIFSNPANSGLVSGALMCC